MDAWLFYCCSIAGTEQIDLTATTPELGEGFPWAFDTHLAAQGIQKKVLC